MKDEPRPRNAAPSRTPAQRRRAEPPLQAIQRTRKTAPRPPAPEPAPQRAPTRPAPRAWAAADGLPALQAGPKGPTRATAALQREFFPRVKRTVVPRPEPLCERDVLGLSGTVRAAAATIHGPHWHHDPHQDLIEIWDAGPALCFRGLLPKKNTYHREGLYLRLSLAYRTTDSAFANIRTLSGENVTLRNATWGAMYDDPHTVHRVTDDCTINVNSIHRDQRLWLQRVDWEWVSRETIFEDELRFLEPLLYRTREEVAAVYAREELDADRVRQLIGARLTADKRFARRRLLLLAEDACAAQDLPALYRKLHGATE